MAERRECAVCLDDIEGEQPARVVPGCNHAFHLLCADTWLSKHSFCPVCRAKLHPVRLGLREGEDGKIGARRRWRWVQRRRERREQKELRASNPREEVQKANDDPRESTLGGGPPPELLYPKTLNQACRQNIPRVSSSIGHDPTLAVLQFTISAWTTITFGFFLLGRCSQERQVASMFGR
ncbi:hypothetical protein ACFX2G_043372 [Malus domestica]